MDGEGMHLMHRLRAAIAISPECRIERYGDDNITNRRQHRGGHGSVDRSWCGLENLLEPMAQETWNVKLIDKGRTLQVQVQAHTQAEARRVAEHHYPGYKAMTAQRA
jgi:hypothetical protein